MARAWMHGRGALAVAATVLLVSIALVLSTAAAFGQTKTFRPVHAARHALVFRPHGVSPQSVSGAHVKLRFAHKRHHRAIQSWRVRAAMRDHRPLRVHKPARARRGLLKVTSKRPRSRPTYTLSIAVGGPGTGTVSGPGISCPGDCSETYSYGTSVTLSANTVSGSSFGGWSGACSGTGSSCQLSMKSNRSVGATFSPSTNSNDTLNVSVGGSGNGAVTGPGIDCPGDCSQTYSDGTDVTLSAAAGSNSSFGGWSGKCSGAGSSCNVTMTGDASVSATFAGRGVTAFYAASSPFNTLVSASPQLASNSSQIVQRIVSQGPPAPSLAGASGTSRDWSHPVYFAKASDPVYTIHQTGWANPDIEGKQIHIPVGAKPAGGGDASFCVVDTDGWEYDFWSANAPSGNGGTFTASFGKRGLWSGDGLGTSSPPYRGGITAAGFSNQAGVIRLSEMQAGVINHALFMSVNGWHGRVWPSANLAGTTGQVDDPNAPAMGQHFWLDLTPAQIDALSVPEWQKIILRAMAKYGMYVGDNGGAPWALQLESGDNYTSFGDADPWVAYAKSQGIQGSYDSTTARTLYPFNFKDAVDWGSKLKVLAPGQ
ncbi:MAG: InlB B-repeat-containing protein [Solirubrobacterales bacterium]